jgi:hypothetical protein
MRKKESERKNNMKKKERNYVIENKTLNKQSLSFLSNTTKIVFYLYKCMFFSDLCDINIIQKKAKLINFEMIEELLLLLLLLCDACFMCVQTFNSLSFYFT